MGLTELETRLLKTAAASGSRITVEQLAKKAGCQADTIHRRLQNEEFRSLFIETMKSSLTAEVPAVLNSFVEAAKAGSFQHGKLVLEIAGAYSDKKEIKANIGVSEGESPFKDDDDRKAFLKETLGKLNLDGEGDFS